MADGGRYGVKIYVVLQRENLAKPGSPNSRIIATKLTKVAAQAVVDATPGTRIEKHFATK